MFKQDKKLVAACVAAVGLWALLFGSLVYPQWTAREAELRTAQEKLNRLSDLIEPAKGTAPKPEADRELEKERAVLMEAINELRRIELGDLGKYKLSAAEKTDPRTYFAQLRRTLVESATLGQGAVRLGDKIKDDLGFGDLAKDDPASLNLVRLFAVSKFMDAAKDAGVQEITGIEYAAQTIVERPEGLEIERLIQIPLVVRVRADERAFAQLLYELQPAPADPRFPNGSGSARYFCVRGLQALVKNPKSTVLDATVQVGALFPESQMKEQQVPIKEETGPGLLRPPVRPW